MLLRNTWIWLLVGCETRSLLLCIGGGTHWQVTASLHTISLLLVSPISLDLCNFLTLASSFSALYGRFLDNLSILAGLCILRGLFFFKEVLVRALDECRRAGCLTGFANVCLGGLQLIVSSCQIVRLFRIQIIWLQIARISLLVIIQVLIAQINLIWLQVLFIVNLMIPYTNTSHTHFLKFSLLTV